MTNMYIRLLGFQILGVCFPIGALIKEKKDDLLNISFDKTMDFSMKNSFDFFGQQNNIRSESINSFNKKQNSFIKIEKISNIEKKFWEIGFMAMGFAITQILPIWIFYLIRRQQFGISQSIEMLRNYSLFFAFLLSIIILLIFSFFSFIPASEIFPLCFCSIEKLREKVFQMIKKDIFNNFLVIFVFFSPKKIMWFLFYFLIMPFFIKDFFFTSFKCWFSFFHILKLKNFDKKMIALLGVFCVGVVNFVFVLYLIVSRIKLIFDIE